MTLSPAARWTLGATATMAVAMGISRFAYTPLLPPMRDAFDWTVTQTGDLASLNYLGYLIGALLAPRALERTPLLPLLATALIGCVLTSALGAYATSFLAWGTLRVLAGIASALCLVAVTTRLGALLAAEPGTRLGHLHFSGVGLGIILSVLLVRDAGAGTPAAVAESWTRLAGISAALLLPAWALFRSVSDPMAPAPTPASATGPATPAAVAAPRGRLRRITAGYGLFGFGYIITATFIVAIAESSAASPQAAQDVWLSAGLAAMPSVPLWHALSRRFGLSRTLAAAYLVEALSVLLAAVAESTVLVHLAAALLGGTFAGITALGLALGSTLAGPAAARVIGTMTAIFAIGQLIGPGIAGRLTTLTGSFVAPSVIAALALILAALLLWQRSVNSQNDRTALTG
ncbi:MAG: YbfB/YjiJ family MFS transporter [Pseudomonadota bacterium]